MRGAHSNQLAKWFAQAKAEGRICVYCGWMIKKKRYEKGFRSCWYCEDARKGVVDTTQETYPGEEVRRLILIRHLK